MQGRGRGEEERGKLCMERFLRKLHRFEIYVAKLPTVAP